MIVTVSYVALLLICMVCVSVGTCVGMIIMAALAVSGRESEKEGR